MRRLFIALAAIFLLAASVAAYAADRPKARFSDEYSYLGAPDLGLTLSLIVAGGGREGFSTRKLIGSLAGTHADAEMKKLAQTFGQKDVSLLLSVFDFVAGDRMHIAAGKHMVMPKAPSIAPGNSKALAAAMYAAGLAADRRFDIEYLLDRLDSHINHVEVMDDIDKKFGRKADAEYHVFFAQLITDLKDLYKL